MRFLVKYNLHILTVAGALVLAYTIFAWESIPETQRAIGLFIAGITLHEWEEMRFPGGFFGLMAKKFGLSDVTEEKMDKAHGAVVIAIVFFAFIPFFLPGVAWLSAVPAILGIFESFIHIVGIKIHGLKRPYTPGMATAQLCLLPPSIWILSLVGGELGVWWAASFAWYLATFILMEVIVWGAFGTNPKKIMANMRK